MSSTITILGPVVALVLWSLVMEAWLYATRIPAISKYKLKVDNQAPDIFLGKMPASVRWKADNYNHLMEQPTIFYAVVLALAVAGSGHGLNTMLAWLYVILRVIHSLIHVTVNHIFARFSTFAVSSVVLLILTLRAAFVIL